MLRKTILAAALLTSVAAPALASPATNTSELCTVNKQAWKEHHRINQDASASNSLMHDRLGRQYDDNQRDYVRQASAKTEQGIEIELRDAAGYEDRVTLTLLIKECWIQAEAKIKVSAAVKEKLATIPKYTTIVVAGAVDPATGNDMVLQVRSITLPNGQTVQTTPIK